MGSDAHLFINTTNITIITAGAHDSYNDPDNEEEALYYYFRLGNRRSVTVDGV